MKRQFSRYVAAMAWPTAVYFLSVIVAALLTKRMDPGWPRMLVAALPLPAIVWLAQAELVRLQRRDELRQRIEQEAMTIAFATSFCVVAMLAFLDLFGALTISVPGVALLMALCWIGAQCWVRARYRYSWLQRDEDETA